MLHFINFLSVIPEMGRIYFYCTSINVLFHYSYCWFVDSLIFLYFLRILKLIFWTRFFAFNKWTFQFKCLNTTKVVFKNVGHSFNSRLKFLWTIVHCEVSEFDSRKTWNVRGVQASIPLCLWWWKCNQYGTWFKKNKRSQYWTVDWIATGMGKGPQPVIF